MQFGPAWSPVPLQASWYPFHVPFWFGRADELYDDVWLIMGKKM